MNNKEHAFWTSSGRIDSNGDILLLLLPEDFLLQGKTDTKVMCKSFFGGVICRDFVVGSRKLPSGGKDTKKKNHFLYPDFKCTYLAIKISLLSLLLVAFFTLIFSPTNYYTLRMTFKSR